MSSLLTLVEHGERGHGRDTNFEGDTFLIIDIDFIKANIRIIRVVGKLLKNGRDLSAGSTPSGPEIDYDWFVAVDDLGEIFEGIDWRDRHFA